MLYVDELNDFASAEPLRAAWRRLLSKTAGATFFHSLDWLETYWRHWAGDQRLRLLVVREETNESRSSAHDTTEAEPIGIVPLTVLREPSPLGAVRILTYPQAYWGSHYGPIGPRPAETLRAALSHIADTPRGWDLLDLRFAPADESDPAATTEMMTAAGFPPTATLVNHTAIIDLPSTLGEYLATRTKKWRGNLRRWDRRLEEKGAVTFLRYRPAGVDRGDGDPRWDLYDQCEQIARASWQGSSTDGTTITHESIRPFLRDAHTAACLAGAADISLMYLDGRPLAFLYGYHMAGSLFGMRTGYDPAVARDGIGNLLYTRVIEDSIHRGDRQIDLSPGYLDAKRPIISRTEPVFRRTWANPRSWRGLAWRMARSTGAALRRERPAVAENASLESLELAEPAASERQ
jgi:CelD/BcsL family acetyltransferase involved in cellulose biosynthesis